MIVSYDYILDSSAWIEYFGGTSKGEKIKNMIEGKKIATSVLAISEIVNKFDKENRPNFHFLEFINKNSAMLTLTFDIAVSSGLLKNILRKKSNKFSLIDAIHLATAREENSILLTTDTDFLQAENVEIVL